MTRTRRIAALIFVTLAPATHAADYPFAVPPLDIYERLGKAGVAGVEPIPPADLDGLAAFWQARSSKAALPPADDVAVTLHLIASGVPASDRAAYLAKLADLTAAAGREVVAAKTDGEKADHLLRVLHRGVMAKKYDEGQTRLNGVFDTNKYNCVSSSALYFLVGTRLGLKLQPILIPGQPYQVGHAAVDLIDGDKRVQIEPTSPEGYDWAEKLKRPNVVVWVPPPDRKKAYDADGFGLAAAAASNRGTAAGKGDAPRSAEGVRCQCIALTLAPTDPTAINNMLAAVTNWALRFDKAKQHEEAVRLHAFARAALGTRGDLEHNYRVVWEHYLDAVFGAGKVAEGLALFPRAAATFPKDKDMADPAAWVIRAARRTADKDGWPAGLAFADAALKSLPEATHATVAEWRSKARRQWSQKRLAAGDVDGSLTVLADGLATTPDNKDLLDGLAYHTQTALDALAKKSGTAAAVAHFKTLTDRFPKAEGVKQAGFRFAARAASALADKKQFADAMKAADAAAQLAGDRAGEVRATVYDAWGRSLAGEQKWEEALAKYAEGVKAVPTDSTLRNNAIALIDRWANKSMTKKEWAEAVRVYDLGLKAFPDNLHLKNNRDYCEQQRKQPG